MHRIEVQERITRSRIELTLRHAITMLLGQRPKGTGKRAWLFGHYRRTEPRKVMRWHCFECFIRQLTPQEYQYFRNAYHDDMASEQGSEQAEAMVAVLDALYYPRREESTDA